MTTYTEEEVSNIRLEERFIAYLVLSSANIKLAQMPQQYREARVTVGSMVDKSARYDDITRERFKSFLVMVDNCVPFQDRPKELTDAYATVIKDILAPSAKKDDE